MFFLGLGVDGYRGGDDVCSHELAESGGRGREGRLKLGITIRNSELASLPSLFLPSYPTYRLA